MILVVPGCQRARVASAFRRKFGSAITSVVILLLVPRHRHIAFVGLGRGAGTRGAARRFGTLILELVRPRDLLLGVQPFEDEVDGGSQQGSGRLRPDAGMRRQLTEALYLRGARQQFARVERVVDLQRAA